MASLIEITNLSREYRSGDGTVVALDGVTISIEAGEMVAIMGASGSGKSTFMHVLGCLDRPTSGIYRIAGRNTGKLDIDELAELRRSHFGFIFQRYHLLADLSALSNVETPAIYSSVRPAERLQRARHLLAALGMTNRERHRPGQLSGGQQQRVSIARALMNDAKIILADEPTGALDRKSGNDVLDILDQLHAEGRTIIIVTHDPTVANRADRIIELSEGLVISDKPTKRSSERKPFRGVSEQGATGVIGSYRAWLDRFQAALGMALASMNAHRLRTALTMLGIVIGVASVVCVVALGEGSRQKVISNISALGTNTLEIFPGKDFGDIKSTKIKTLVLSDVQALRAESFAAAVSPTVSTNNTLRYRGIEANAQVNGVGEEYFEAKGTKLAEGRFLDSDSIRSFSQDAVIDDSARKAIFAQESGPLVGRTILVGRVPCRIIGVIQQQQGGFGSSGSPSVYLPYTTVQARFLGDRSLRSVTLRVADHSEPSMSERLATDLLKKRHGTKDFFILNTDDVRRTITSTAQALTLLVAVIAVISLIVGGIGVMNIMLVSVSERVGEIGVRMAVGARRSDILQQFLMEAVTVCLIGGLLGVTVAIGFGETFNALDLGFQLVYSVPSIILAFASATLIGLVFGYMPARNASLLDPVVCLASE